jgi:hypothetical protein
VAGHGQTIDPLVNRPREERTRSIDDSVRIGDEPTGPSVRKYGLRPSQKGLIFQHAQIQRAERNACPSG